MSSEYISLCALLLIISGPPAFAMEVEKLKSYFQTRLL
ncbi:hypothetical protein PCIT_a1424 [Pseudoalteromonas citrea]|uniref:Uncharacterized protein n=1 Tax=Pseudoalteromonas citrea TaxID=43655 RepID=A0AAD4AM96_9GAMM|nr:hypothetical protein PCIT_a1424 [Pseudoalteromonas citrea]